MYRYIDDFLRGDDVHDQATLVLMQLGHAGPLARHANQLDLDAQTQLHESGGRRRTRRWSDPQVPIAALLGLHDAKALLWTRRLVE
jgi:hypothetical protein